MNFTLISWQKVHDKGRTYGDRYGMYNHNAAVQSNGESMIPTNYPRNKPVLELG